MANGPRSIYSRRQRLGPARYDNPLADFLDNLPGYVNQFQQNQLALGRQQLADKRYEDSLERQKMMDDFSMARATGDQNVIAGVLRRYGRSDEASNLEKSAKIFSDISADYSDVINMPTEEKYSNLNKVKDLMERSTSLIPQYASDNSGRGMYIRNMVKDLKSTITNIESTAGTFRPLKDYTATDQSMFNSFTKARDKSQERLDELEPRVLSIITKYKGNQERAKNDLMYQQIQSNILLEQDKILRYNQGMSNIQSKYRYPELADQTMTYSEETDFVVDNDDLILNNPDLAEKLQVWLDDPDNKDNYNIFKSAADELLSIDKKQDTEINSETEVVKDDRQYVTSGLYGKGRDVPVGDKIIEGLVKGIGDVASGLPLPIPGGPIFGQDAPEEDAGASSVRVVGPTQISDQQALDILENFK